jgi:hypothetical protein
MTEDGTTVTPAQGVSAGASLTGGSLRATLTAQDVRRLTLFKWRYSLESAGFTSRQAAHVLFLKWLYARRRPVVG